MSRPNQNQSAPRVVVIGGGFGGLRAFRVLEKAGLDVTLVDRHPYTTFQPLLYQVATGGLNPGDITYSLRRFVSSHAEGHFRRATVTGIDHANKLVQVSRGAPIPYDKLVIAAGVGPNFFGIPGAQDNARSIYSRGESLEVRDVIFSGLEQLAGESDPNRRFTVLVVGGGATGVEMAGTLAEMKSEALPAIYPELPQDSFRVVLVEMMDALLGPFERPLQRYALRELRKRGVDVRLSTAVAEVTPNRVRFAEGPELDVDLVVWASGVAVPDAVAQWGLPQGRAGRITVDRTLRVEGMPDVYAVGDCAIITDDPLPQLAQPAMQMGEHAAHQIVAEAQGRPLTEFRYHDKGTMATIGRNAAVVQFPKGPRLTGLPAWVLWVVVHLSVLLGGRNRLQAMVNMLFRYLAWPKSAAGILGDITPSPAELSRPEASESA